MHFLDIPYGFNFGRVGILVEPHELDIFVQYVKHHNINHGYANFASTIKRIKNQGYAVIFYFDDYRMRYYTWGCSPWNMRRVKLCDLYEEAVDLTDVLKLLA